MKAELQKKLFKDHAGIFRQRKLSMRVTAMCWGIACGDGWYDLINSLCKKIEWYIKTHKNIPKIEATQVKEKFGGLRFYYDGGDEVISEFIMEAERLSYKTCEECGTQTKVKTWYVGWHRTLCIPCAKKLGSYYTPLYFWYFNNIRRKLLKIRWWIDNKIRRRK